MQCRGAVRSCSAGSACRRFERHHRLLPVLTVHWVDADLHARAVSALLAAARRDVSLVDWTSFELMRVLGVEQAFAYDDDVAKQGFAAFT